MSLENLHRHLNHGLFDYEDDLQREGMEPDSAFPPPPPTMTEAERFLAIRAAHSRAKARKRKQREAAADAEEHRCDLCGRPETKKKPLRLLYSGTYRHTQACSLGFERR